MLGSLGPKVSTRWLCSIGVCWVKMKERKKKKTLKNYSHRVFILMICINVQMRSSSTATTEIRKGLDSCQYCFYFQLLSLTYLLIHLHLKHAFSLKQLSVTSSLWLGHFYLKPSIVWTQQLLSVPQMEQLTLAS